MTDVRVEAASSPSLLARIAGTFCSPFSTFGRLGSRPPVLDVLLLALVIQAAVGFLLGPMEGREAAEFLKTSSILERPGINDAMRAELIAATEHPSPARRVGGLIGKALTTVFCVTFYAALFYAAARIAGGSPRFKAVLSVAAHVSLVLVGLASALRLPVALASGSVLSVTFSPAILLDRPMSSVAYRLLSSFDVFWIWSAVLASAGVAIVSRVRLAGMVAFGLLLYLLTAALFFVVAGFLY